MTRTAHPTVPIARVSNADTKVSAAHYLDLPEGRLAYDDTGTPGPLVIAAPGLGDLRQTYRALVPRLADAGYRVITVDLPGHGESSTGWADHSPEAFGEHLIELARHLGAGPAVLIGNSFSGAAVAWAAARSPQDVAGLVLVGPFVRDIPIGLAQRLTMRLAFAGPWRVAAWIAYFGTLFPVSRPADHTAYVARLRRNLREPGRFEALKAMLATSRARVERALADVRAPALVVMGSRDPDFRDPRAEAELVAGRLGGRAAMIEGAGHYPQAEMPDATAPAILEFLREVAPGAPRA